MARARLGGDVLIAAPIVLALAFLPRVVGAAAEAVPPTFSTDPPATRLAAAATALEASTQRGAPGYRFEITQTQTLVARPGGPRIEIPDPTDRHKVLEVVDRYLALSLVERGIVTPDGFWSEIRTGPAPGEPASFETGEYRFGALVRDGVSWRAESRGWYESSVLPGIGLDPATAAKLPEMLRQATEPQPPSEPVRDAGRWTETVAARTVPADVPGVVAADGAAFTEIREPVEIRLDDQGRLAGLRVVAINTNETRFDLVIETEIQLFYGFVGSLPQPEPAYVAPTPEPPPLLDLPPGYSQPPLAIKD